MTTMRIFKQNMRGSYAKKSLSLLLVTILVLGFIPSFIDIPQINAASSDPIDAGLFESRAKVNSTYARGEDWETVSLGDNSFITSIGLPMQIWSEAESSYQSYIYNDRYSSDGYYEIQTGRIGVQIYDYYAKFFNPNMSEVRVYDERWEVQEWKSQGQGSWSDIGAQSGQPVFNVVYNENDIHITKSFISWAGQLNITYSFVNGDSLKHTTKFSSSISTETTFRVKQVWAGIVGDRVIYRGIGNEYQGGFNVITGSILTPINSTLFDFSKSDGSFSIRENQYEAIEWLEPVIIDTHAQGMKADFIFSNWTLIEGDSLEIDPTTTTIQPSTEDVFWRNRYPTTNYNGETRMIVGDAWGDYDGSDRGILEFTDLSSISVGATVSEVIVSLYQYDGAKGGAPIPGNSYTTNLNRVLLDWNEAQSTWNVYSTGNNWNSGGASGVGTDIIGAVSGSATVTYTTRTWVNFTGAGLVNDVQGWFDSDFSNYGWRLQSDGEFRGSSPYWYGIFYSSEYGTASNRPKLYVTYTVPPPNTSPTVDNLTIIDFDDTNNLYAQAGYYTILYNVTDEDGFADIDYIEVRINQSATNRAIFRYDEDTNTFSIISGSSKWDLDTGGSSATESGNYINTSFKFMPQWDADVENDLDFEGYIIDSVAEADSSVLQSNYADVITDLVTTFSINDDRGSLSQSITVSGSVTYSGSSVFPPDAEFTSVSVYDTSNNNKGTDNSVTNGAWSISVTAEATVGLMTYNLFINMADADYTDGEETSPTDTFITDRYVTSSFGNTDSRTNLDESETFWFKLRSEYDNRVVGSGESITLNNSQVATWSVGNNRWEFTTSKSSAQHQAYYVNAITDTFGTTSLQAQSGNTTSIIWDSITITITIGDGRINIATNASVSITAVYDYDGSTFDGTFTMNNTDYNEPTAIDKTYTVISVSGDSYGITVIDTNDIETIIWDSLTITITVTDSRININTNATVSITAIRDYDSSVFDGSFTMNSTTYNYASDVQHTYTVSSVTGGTYDITTIDTNDIESIIWDSLTITITVIDNRINTNTNASVSVTAIRNYDNTPFDGILIMNNTDYNEPNVKIEYYTVSSASGGTYDITTIDTNDIEFIIWDKVKAISTTISDIRDNINEVVTIDWTLVYEYDLTQMVDGTVTIEGVSATHQGSGVWRISPNEASVIAITYNEFTSSGNANGITIVNINSQTDTVIWDSLTITITVIDNRININTNATVYITAIRDYDATPFDGTLIMNNTDYNEATVKIESYTISSVNGDGTYAITTINTNDIETIIWDRVKATSTTVSDTRDNVGDTVTVDWTIKFEFDDILVTTGTVTIEGISAVHQGSGVWRISPNEASVTSTTFDEFTSDSNTYGITVENANSQTDTVIWDRVYATATVISDTRGDIGTTVTVDWTLKYEFDDTLMTDGTVTIEGVGAVHQGSGVWRISPNYGSVIGVTYNEFTTSGNTYDITVANANGQSDLVIWDRLEILTVAFDDSRIDVSGAFEVRYQIRYDYDNQEFDVADGSITGFAWDAGNSWWDKAETGSASVTSTNWDETDISITDTQFGLTAVEDDAGANIITDRTYVTLTTISDSRDDIGDTVTVDWTLRFEFDDTFVTIGTVTIEGVGAVYQGSGVWRISPNEASVIAITYNEFTSESNDYGITVENYNSQTDTVIWDRIEIVTVAFSDNRVDISASVEVRYTIRYDYDNTAITDGTCTIGGGAASYDGGNDWWERTFTQSASVASTNYDESDLSCTSNTHGITVKEDVAGANVITDRIEIVNIAFSDSRIDISATTEIRYTLRYDYDNGLITDGTCTVSGNSAIWDAGNGWWDVTFAQSSSVTSTLYDENDLACSGNLYGITVNQAVAGSSVITDRLTITSVAFSEADFRLNIGASTEVRYTIEYDYDNTPLVDGSCTISGGAASYDGGNGWWKRTFAQSGAVVSTKYDENDLSCSGNTHGITAKQDVAGSNIITDSLTVTITIGTSPINVGVNATISVTATRDYDASSFDGNFVLNYTTYVHDIQIIKTYTVTSVNGGTYSITTISTNDIESVEWIGMILSIKVLAADGTTNADDISTTILSLVNASGIIQGTVSSGWLNYTGLEFNANVVLSAQIFNTTTSNSFVKVNSSDTVTINVTSVMSRTIILSVYQSVTLTFQKDDSTSFTPTSMSITFGNNGTTANVVTGSIFVNGSNTINSITWQGDNVKNVTSTFEVTSDSQDLVFEGRIYTITPTILDINSLEISTGITYNITMNNAGNTSSLSHLSSSSFYMQNGSIITTTWWRGVLVNTTATFTITATSSISINAQVGSDSFGNTRFAEGTSISGVNSMMIEGLAVNYQFPPISLIRNITTYSTTSSGWNYSASLNLLNLTLSNMKSLTIISSISINVATSLVSFNTTGSGMTLYSVSYSIYSQTLTDFGAAFYDNADHYQDNTFIGISAFNLQQPWSNYNSTSCFSANIIQYSKVPAIVATSLPNAIGLISDANTAACKNVEGRIMAIVKLNTTASILNSVSFNYSITVPTGVNGSYNFIVAFTYNTPNTIGSIILNQSLTTSVNGSTVLYFSSTNNQIIWVQFILQATPGNSAAYTDGCTFSTFTNGVCVTIDEVFITNAGGYIYPHNFNIAWAYNYNWFNVVTYPTTISINYPATIAFTDLQYVPVPTPDRFLPLEFSNLVTVFITASEAPGYYRTMIPSGLNTGNQTIHIDEPSIVNQITLQINDLTSKFPVGSEIYISRSGLAITSGYMGEGNLFTAWLSPASYTFILVSGSDSYTSIINVPAASRTIVVYIAVSEITTPASDSSSISYSAIWNEGTNNTVQVTYNDLTAGTTAITFNLYAKNSTCPTGCLVSSVSAPPGSYSTYTNQLPANYADLNSYYVEIVSTNPAFGTNTFGPIGIGKLNLPIGHIEPPSLDGLGFSPYISSWVTIYDLLSFFVIIITAGLFTKKDGSITMIAIAAEGILFTNISIYASGEITWTHITPGFFAIIGILGVFMYLRQKEITS